MASGGDLSLTILGFLHERPMHGYELKSRLTALTGHLRPVSDGALYPAISRLEGKGLVERHEEAGAAAARRQVLTITPAGREELLRRLREPPTESQAETEPSSTGRPPPEKLSTASGEAQP
ncbi:PadR family transcriptional regulator, partial [Nonomuraea fuscirosea]|uniref:PadR family transcriptional regulator n=1 Tax=Nonomuraea fuscirosea TaxID=1291556 RepID=UPI00343C6A70